MTQKTIRLLMPQWQGGDNPNYSFGAELLAWLAPDNDQPLIHVPVEAYDGTSLVSENGIKGRTHLLQQLEAAQHIIQAHQPDRIVMFGGDCLVEQAPFAYLNERYGGELGLIWIDAHGDLVRYEGYDNGHTLPLGNLLGEGDPEFAKHVNVPLKPEHVFMAGLTTPTEQKKPNDSKIRYPERLDTEELNPEYKLWIRLRSGLKKQGSNIWQFILIWMCLIPTCSVHCYSPNQENLMSFHQREPCKYLTCFI